MKCFYHNDLDGRCAGSIVLQTTLNRNKVDYYEVDYVMKLPLEKIEDGEQVWFVDYSFTENTLSTLKYLVERGCDVIWIDHHTSSVKLENKHTELKSIKGVRKEGLSGAYLTYMYCNHIPYDYEIAPKYIKLVSDYDCWQYKLEPDTTYFKLGMDSIYYDVFGQIWDELSDEIRFDSERSLEWIISRGKSVKDYITQDNTYYREHFAYETKIAGHKCLVVNKKTNSWVFGDKYNKYPLVMVWVFDGEKFTYSIFSNRKSIDCSKIAESYGGGGHKGAAGFSSTELLFKKN